MHKLPFKAAWWLPGPHLQTLWPTFMRRRKKIALRRERIELSDGDFLDLDWFDRHKKGPIVLILHGLEGSSHSPYAKGMLQALAKMGWRGVVMHFRGCSGEPNRLTRSYHSGETRDFSTILTLLNTREPGVPIAVIGYSLGGNVLLKWLGEVGQTRQLVAAVAVSVPFELDKAVDELRHGFSRFYERHFLRQLCQKMTKKFSGERKDFVVPPRQALRTLREFDNCVTAPLHGFLGAQDYYVRSSSRQFLKSIQVPTLLVQAKDDPFMPVDVIPLPQELSPLVQLEVTERGGHVGFIAGKWPWRPMYWLEQRIPDFLSQFI